MDLYLKNKNYLNGEYFVTSEDFSAICPYYPGPGIYGLCWEYDIIEKINLNEDGYFDFSKGIIDIGSEDGGYAIFCNFNKGYCFEPNKQMCALIWTNMYLKNKINDIEVYNVFLGDKEDEIMFNGFSSEGGVNYDIRGRQEPVKVKEHLLDEYNIKNVGLIKTDTEGFDYFVLKGGINTIINNNYPPILFENWEIGYREGSDTVWSKENHDRLDNFIESLGYTIFKQWGGNDTHLAVKLDKDEKTKYIVSMTTIPSRKKRIKDNIKSILEQSWQGFYKYCINIDDNLGEEDYAFYESLKELDERIEINICENKWRSCNKLLPTLKKYPDAVIITVDDDICYGKDCLKYLAEEYEKNPDCVIAHEINPIIVKDGKFESFVNALDLKLGQKEFGKYLSNCCLFPPHIFDNTDLFDYDKMMYCTKGTHDELWFWIMSTINGHNVIGLNYVREFGCSTFKDTYSDGYRLTDINNNDLAVGDYCNRIKKMYGNKLNEVLGKEKIKFVLTKDNIYNFFYNSWIIRNFYDKNFVLDVSQLDTSYLLELSDFLNGSGLNLDDVKM